MRSILATILSLLPLAAMAETDGYNTFTLVPSTPSEITPVRVRVQSIGCQVLPSEMIVRREGNAIHAEFDLSDDCFPNLAPQEKTYDLGTLAAGTYTVHYDICGAAPIPPDWRGCYTTASTVLGVASFTSSTTTIPALGSDGLMLLTLCAAALGARRLSSASRN